MAETKNNPYVQIIIFLSFIVLCNVIFVYTHQPLKTETIQVQFSVGNSVGIDVDSTALNYGRILPGGLAVRNVIVNNSYDIPVKVNIFISSGLEKYVSSEKNNVVLPPFSQEKISFYLVTQTETNQGNYSGTVKFVFRKA